MDFLDVLILFLIGVIVVGAVMLVILLKGQRAGKRNEAGEGAASPVNSGRAGEQDGGASEITEGKPPSGRPQPQ